MSILNNYFYNFVWELCYLLEFSTTALSMN